MSPIGWQASILQPSQNPSAPSTPETRSDFFAQFNQKESKPEPVSEPPARAIAPSWMMACETKRHAPDEKDELSEWFTQASGQPRRRS